MLPSRGNGFASPPVCFASAEWSPQEVKTWLTSVGFPEVAAAAWARRVTGIMLLFLGEEGWRELGIASAVERARILSLVSSLNATSPSNPHVAPAPVVRPALPVPRSASALARFSRVVAKLDGVVWCDHKKVWFEHLMSSGKQPEEYKDIFCMQLDSYNLMTLLLLSGVLPTATGVCAGIGWDADGWPLDKLKFAFLMFSAALSGMMICHFGLSHVLHLLVSGVSSANYPIFLKAFGHQLLAEAGLGYVVIVFLFVPWIMLCTAVLISHANFTVWLLSFLSLALPWLAYQYLTPILLGRDDDGHRPLLFDGFHGRAKVLLRLAMHGGLFGEKVPLDEGDAPEELIEQLAELSLQAPHIRAHQELSETD
ncbi:unnamed protein product [Durusdinium trenchii]|uniref:SAM domain-containing protein n=1 Tax=Durusdinium trenchii TaxID=1381693 RepID=A0ABP0RC49_9DINO